MSTCASRSWRTLAWSSLLAACLALPLGIAACRNTQATAQEASLPGEAVAPSDMPDFPVCTASEEQLLASAPYGLDDPTVVVSDDGRQVAFGTVRDDATLVTHGAFTYTAPQGGRVRRFWFGPGGRLLFLVEEGGGSSRVVVNGEAGPAFDQVYEEMLATSLDGRRYAYVAARRGEQYVVLDGEEHGPFDRCIGVSFTGDNRHCVFAVRRGRDVQVVVDGAVARTFTNGQLLSMAVPDRELRVLCHVRAGTTRKESVYIDDRQEGPYDAVLPGKCLFTADGLHYAYATRTGGRLFTVYDGIAHGPFEVIMPKLVLSGDGAHVGGLVRQDGVWHLTLNGAVHRALRVGHTPVELLSREDAFAVVARDGEGGIWLSDGDAYNRLGDRLVETVQSRNNRHYGVVTRTNLSAIPRPSSKPLLDPRYDEVSLVLDGREALRFVGLLSHVCVDPSGRHAMGKATAVSQGGISTFVMLDGMWFSMTSYMRGVATYGFDDEGTAWAVTTRGTDGYARLCQEVHRTHVPLRDLPDKW